ncbi:hypothetical protein Patl1_35033 [Pistacia atlantica]|uniref:Uncharacterized protein n=1 Tax=Pistacia atlantica TaxID=434234 RepID=A0ACC0ZT52_9ROSI|nr:hypothetical protein Patl1_35033 [Pistacia atlantica]
MDQKPDHSSLSIDCLLFIFKSDSPFQKHQISGNNDDFITSKRTGYPAVGRNFDFKKVITQPGWSYSEDAKDNLSLLSEESCSSSAG